MEDIRSNIFTTADSLFTEYGIKSVSVDDICHELGISKKTFYQYFDGKEELVAQLLDHNNKRVYENVMKYMEGKTALECVSMLTNMHKKVGKNSKQPKTVYDLKKYYPALYKKQLHEINKNTKDILTRHLCQGQEEGLYRKDLDVDMCAIMFSLIQLEIIRNGYELEGVSKQRLINFIMDSFFRSIISEEGKKKVAAISDTAISDVFNNPIGDTSNIPTDK